MGRKIELFIKGITNSFHTDLYTQMVTPTREFGHIIKNTNLKREKSSNKISKKTDERISKLTTNYR